MVGPQIFSRYCVKNMMVNLISLYIFSVDFQTLLKLHMSDFRNILSTISQKFMQHYSMIPYKVLLNLRQVIYKLM